MLKLNEFVKRYDKALFILGLAVIALLMLGFTNAFADNIITYGKSTYSQVGDKIIFGSLGDEFAVSEFGSLGGNDFIPENAFKNLLGYEGYTETYDYNPTYDGYYDSFYKKPLPGKDLVAIDFAGLGANPREIQKAWVLRSEYERLNAEEQARRMDSMDLTDVRIEQESIGRDSILQNNIDDEIFARQDADNNLGKRITKETKQRKNADTKLNNKINKETTARKQADKQEKQERIAGDKKLHKEIVNETKDRKSADKTLQSNINKETTQRKTADKTEKKERILGDKKLQNNINVVDNNSKSRDNTLQTNIDNEATTRATADNNLQSNINNTNSRIDDVSNRVSKLEGTQTKLQVGIRVYDSKRITVTPYISQNFTRGLVDEVGVRVTVKLGKSYEEKLIDKQDRRLAEIEKRVGVAPVIEKVINEKGQTKSIRIIENGLAVDSQF